MPRTVKRFVRQDCHTTKALKQERMFLLPPKKRLRSIDPIEDGSIVGRYYCVVRGLKSNTTIRHSSKRDKSKNHLCCAFDIETQIDFPVPNN